MEKKVPCFLLALLCYSVMKAQVDPHFSQYYTYPMWLNPALTGTMDGDYRVSAIYRNQWNEITDPFSTIGISADMQTQRNVNFGINILQQTAGSGGYSYLNAQASISYTGIKFGDEGEHRISFALQPGIVGRSFDQSTFKGGDQWVPIIGYNPTMPNSDILIKPSSYSFDLGAGVAYYNTNPERKVNAFAGISISHLTQPQDPFLIKNTKSVLPIRYTVHGGARIAISDAGYFVPNFLYMSQSTANETMLGGYFQLAAGQANDVMLGAKYRIKDAVSPFAAILVNDRLLIGLSYDITTSQLAKMINGTNALELSITLLGQKTGQPDFFKCPRF